MYRFFDDLGILDYFSAYANMFFCIFEVFNNHRAYIAHLPKTFPGICDALNNYYFEKSIKISWLYQTTILGTQWDLEDTIVINTKSCQANYQYSQ
jgi:hypothetical protein